MRIGLFLLYVLLCFDAFSQTNYVSNHQITTSHGLPSNIVYWTHEDAQGDMWVATNQGVMGFRNNTKRFFTINDGLPQESVFKIYEDTQHRLWLLGAKGVAVIVNDSLHVPSWSDSLYQVLSGDFLYTMVSDAQGKSYVATYAKSPGYFEIDAQLQLTFVPQSATENGVNTLLDAQNKGIVFGVGMAKGAQADVEIPTHVNKRLLVAGTAQQKVVVAFKEIWVKEGDRPAQLVYTFPDEIIDVITYGKGYLIAVRNVGLIYFEVINGVFSHGELLFEDDLICHINRTRLDELWLATSGNGIVVIPSLRLQFYPLPVNQRVTFHYSSPHLLAVTSDSMYTFTLSQGTISEIDTRKNTNTRVALSGWENRYVQGDSLYNIHGNNPQFVEGYANNTYWKYVTADTSLTHVIYYNEERVRWTHQGKVWQFFIPHVQIQYVCWTHDDEALVATSGGLYRANWRIREYSRLSFESVNFAKRVTDSLLLLAKANKAVFIQPNGWEVLHEFTTVGSINDIQEDAGKLYIATKNGIIVLDARTFEWLGDFALKEGMKSQHIKRLWIDDQWVICGAYEGIHVLEKSRIITEASNELFIASGSLNHVPLTPHQKVVNIQGLSNVVNLALKRANYAFRPAPMQYRLTGLFTDWKTTASGEISFYNLKEGTYILEGRLLGENDSVGPTKQLLTFMVRPYLWERTWVWVVMVLVVTGGALFGVFYMRMMRLRLAGQNQEIQGARLKSLYSQLSPHFTFNALNTIQFYLVKKEGKKAITYLQEFSELMRLRIRASMKQHIPLREELQALRLYVDLEQTRLEQEIDLQISGLSVDEQTDFQVPSFIFHPLAQCFLWQQGQVPPVLEVKLATPNDLHITFKAEWRESESAFLAHTEIKRLQHRMELLNAMEKGHYDFSFARTNGQGIAIFKLPILCTSN